MRKFNFEEYVKARGSVKIPEDSPLGRLIKMKREGQSNPSSIWAKWMNNRKK